MELLVATSIIIALSLLFTVAGLYVSLSGWLNQDGVLAIRIGSTSTIAFLTWFLIRKPDIQDTQGLLAAVLLIAIGSVYVAGQNFLQKQGHDHLASFRRTKI